MVRVDEETVYCRYCKELISNPTESEFLNQSHDSCQTEMNQNAKTSDLMKFLGVTLAHTPIHGGFIISEKYMTGQYSIQEILDFIAEYMPTIYTLEILNIDLSDINLIFHGYLLQLTALHLQNNNLSYFPEYIFSLLDLTTIIVINNKLSSIPISILKLNNLKKLVLYSNIFETLPSYICDTNIEDLSLDENNIKTLPEAPFPNLYKLNLNHNKLTTIPLGLRNYLNLNYLSIDSNFIEFTESDFNVLVQLTNLKTLFILGNPISNLKYLEKFLSLVSLKKLFISEKNINQEFIKKYESILPIYGAKEKDFEFY